MRRISEYCRKIDGPAPIDLLAEIIKVTFNERRIQLRFWNDFVKSPGWEIFTASWGPPILETAPSPVYIAIMVCSALLGATKEGKIHVSGDNHPLDDPDLPVWPRLVQYLNDHSEVRKLVLKQFRIMEKDVTLRVLPIVYFGDTVGSIDHCLRGRFLRNLVSGLGEKARESLDLLFRHGVVDDGRNR